MKMRIRGHWRMQLSGIKELRFGYIGTAQGFILYVFQYHPSDATSDTIR